MPVRRLRQPADGAPPGTALAISTAAFTLALFGTTVVNVALPAVRGDLGGTVTDLQWVANAYTLMLASLLLSMGALCDQRGARRVLLGGIALFCVGATLGAVAPSIEVLVAAQLILGAGGAALVPASLTIISHGYHDPVARARAIAVYASASAAGVAAGPVAGGLLIDAIGWRGMFAVEGPVALAIGAVAVLGLRETPCVPARHLDLAGQAAAIVALGALVLGLMESGASGWASSRTLAPIAVAVVAGAVFVAVERHGSSPMLPLSLFRVRVFSVAATTGLLNNFGIYGLLFVLSLYLQDVRGLSALDTGLMFAVQMIAAALVALPSGRITGRIGPRLPAAVGSAIAGAGAVVLLFQGTETSHALTVVGFMLLGAGGGTTIPAVTAALVMQTPSSQVGMAAAAYTASRQAGAMLGVAVLGAMVATESFVDGMRLALAVTAVVFAVVSVMALQLLPRAGS